MHAIDTIKEAASLLAQVCNPIKPVVLTCAMHPPHCSRRTAPERILDVFIIATYRDVADVFIICAGRIHLAPRVQKIALVGLTFLLEAKHIVTVWSTTDMLDFSIMP